MNATMDLTANLDAVITRADGSTESVNLSSGKLDFNTANNKVKNAYGFWKRLFTDEQGLVTTAAVNYMAADFLSGSSARINAFTWADCGTGTTSAAIGDTALQTPYGGSRVSGTQSNPVSGTYKNVATISFTSTLAITEYGLFSASSTGTLFDHRIFSAINVNSGDQITFSYSVQLTAGGS